MFHSPDNQKKNTVALLFQDVTLSSWNTRNKTAFLQKVILDVINVACSVTTQADVLWIPGKNQGTN